MSRKSSASRPVLPRQVVHYVDTATPAELTFPLSPAELAARREENQARYELWKVRQLAIAERDRKARRFWLGFGAVIALGVLTALGVGGWLLWQALAALNIGALAGPLLLVLVVIAGVGGHRCITTIQHWH